MIHPVLLLIVLLGNEATGITYETIGCFKDTGNRAIPTLEGQDSILDGNYRARSDAKQKCYQAAKKRGFKVFALQHSGWCASSADAENTFDKYGKSSACGNDGEGGPWANQVYYIKDYEGVGCYKDTGSRAIQTLEGKDVILDGPYRNRKNAIAKCAAAARRKGFHMFAVQHGGWCAASATAEKTFDKYGKSGACQSDGEGGAWANNVYVIEDFKSLGCYKDTGNRAIPTLEGKDSILDGPYRNRKNAIAKCAVAARRKGFHMFAVQHGGWCAASTTAEKTFDKYGKSTTCANDGEGGPWGNNVYVIEDYTSLGCYKDTGNRAIPSLEGKDSILDGSYRNRKNARAKCAVAARRKGFHMFAVQHGGWCAASATAEKTFDKYGKSGTCESDGEGGPWGNNVYVIEDFTSLGCYKDTGNRAIPTLEGKDSILDGPYRNRENAIAKCAVAARKRGFHMFAVQHGGWCASSATAETTFDKYGKSGTCEIDGEGGPWGNNVYVIEDFTSLGCYKDTGNRAIPTLEGKDSILDGPYRNRENAIAKCAVAARKRGFQMFAVQHGGWCASSATAEMTFDKYGKSSTCENDGEGGPWGNNVYALNECSNSPCKNGATCVSLQGSYRCNCESGYTGKNCEADVNECATGPCKNGATCANLKGSYRCNCKSGYTGNNCQTDVNECTNSPCKNGATCANLQGSYRCDCRSGYTGNNCETDVNECTNSPCKSEATCVNLQGSYRCDCRSGYTGNNCEIDINECTNNPCNYGGTCINFPGYYRCGCTSGYTGYTCETDIDECAANHCQNEATCVNLVGDYRCDCKSGYTGSNCETDINECSPDPCQNGATCVDLVGRYSCNCASGFTGGNCETDINECSPDPCQNGATCVDLVGSYSCNCASGFTGGNCETVNIKVASSVNECVSSPCQNGGHCVDLDAGYRCDCTPDFIGVNCEEPNDECEE